MLCPNCNDTCWRDEVDIGVGTQCGPWRCSGCGWYEGHEVDAIIDADREAEAAIRAFCDARCEAIKSYERKIEEEKIRIGEAMKLLDALEKTPCP